MRPRLGPREILLHQTNAAAIRPRARITELRADLRMFIPGIDRCQVPPTVEPEVVRAEIRPRVLGDDRTGRVPGRDVTEYLVPGQRDAVLSAPARQCAKKSGDADVRVPLEEVATPRQRQRSDAHYRRTQSRQAAT